MKLEYIIDKKYDKKFVGRASDVDREHFDEIYKATLPFLKTTRGLYQASWNKIGPKFSRYVESQTGYRWFYPVYTCVLSIHARGISNWGHHPIIMRSWKENPHHQRRITAHELILSHYFEIYRRNFSKYKLLDTQVWALAEIAAIALTSTKEARKFWPWDYHGYYFYHNYPQIVSLQKKLQKPFEKKDGFDSYVRTGLKLVRNYPNIKPNKRGK